ncbi:MAG TPA: hypothetical protein PKE69_08175, partial [Pyrinomonadaceae bacterium]|nr:hypothetical protein [Pyrinomonadaceae bacterium]
MNKFKNIFSVYLAVGLMMFGFAANLNAQNRNQQDVRVILRSLNSEIDDFRYSFDAEMSRNSVNRNDKNAINKSVNKLEDSISEFDGKFQRGRETSRDVSDILTNAKGINDFVYQQKFGQNIQTDWMNVRNLLDRLAQNYGVNSDWQGNNTNYSNTNYSTNSLTGTYDFNQQRSDNTREIVEDANVQTDEQRRDLDVRGGQVIIASSKSAPFSLTTDGRDRDITLDNGQKVRVRATLRGQELTISSRDRDSDYTSIYSSQDNGNSMKVTRRITTNYLNQTVFAESFYGKSDSIARLGIDTNTNSDVYSSNDQDDYPQTTTTKNGEFIVPSGTVITGTLQNDISTKVSQNNDRFSMVVDQPNQFRGAVIEGYLSGIQRSGKATGRSKITFNFERIRLPNGQTYD